MLTRLVPGLLLGLRLLLYPSSTAAQPPVVGAWEGTLQVPVGPTLPLVFHIAADGGGYAGELDGLNHRFQAADTGAPSEYALIEETLAPELLETVTSWILERFSTP